VKFHKVIHAQNRQSKNVNHKSHFHYPILPRFLCLGICNILRRSNCAGALQYVPALTWILFLRILDDSDAQEAERSEAVGAAFTLRSNRPTAGGIGLRPMAGSGSSCKTAR
jgi:hypothetical protein